MVTNTHHYLVTPIGLLIAPIQKTTKAEVISLNILHPLLPDQYGGGVAMSVNLSIKILLHGPMGLELIVVSLFSRHHLI